MELADQFEQSIMAASSKNALNEVKLIAKQLASSLVYLDDINDFKGLCALPKALINKLICFEEALINYLELTSEGIEYRTSGHFRDVLDIYRDALKDELTISCNVHISLDSKAKLCFNVADRIRIYL